MSSLVERNLDLSRTITRFKYDTLCKGSVEPWVYWVNDVGNVHPFSSEDVDYANNVVMKLFEQLDYQTLTKSAIEQMYDRIHEIAVKACYENEKETGVYRCDIIVLCNYYDNKLDAWEYEDFDKCEYINKNIGCRFYTGRRVNNTIDCEHMGQREMKNATSIPIRVMIDYGDDTMYVYYSNSNVIKF